MAEQEDAQEKEIGCRLLRVYKRLFKDGIYSQRLARPFC